MDRLQKIIFFLFASLFFFVPLVLWPFTSEVFEFNKMVLVYILTILITGAWLARTVLARKIIFRRTILDTPLLIFLGSQLISTILSIDPLTSWLGYYSRFNGGLLSTVCYSLLYWAFVSNFGKRETLNLLKVWLASATLVSIYGVLEHFGIDKSVWVQDVQSRIFSTLGQPNWLAAWLVALIPLTWANAISNFQFPIRLHRNAGNELSKSRFLKFLIYFSLPVLFFWTIIFTKSRSGLVGFTAAFIIFWGLHFWQNSRLTDPGSDRHKSGPIPFIIITSSLLIIGLISGTEFTPGVFSQKTSQVAGDTALETGGTESGTIRKIVWKGAANIWAHYPVFGTGVETFAFSYYKFRPAEHNLTSEWDFIYNKAHNEFLNVAANTGTVGLLSYLFLIGSSIYLFIKELKISNLKSQISNKYINSKIENEMENGKWKMVNASLLAGYVSLLVTNFFGFSVVPTQLQFFLFPAFAIVLMRGSERVEEYKPKKITNIQKAGILLSCSLALLLFYSIYKYWYADVLYAKGKAYNSAQKPDVAAGYLTRAIAFEPNQALYHNDLASSYVNIASAYFKNKDMDNAKKFTDLAISESDTAISLSPANVAVIKRSRFGVFIILSTINPNYLLNARDTLIDAISLAPTDAKLYYNLGLTYARIGQTDLALSTLKKTVELKTNYRDARLAYAILLINQKQNDEARVQLEYILKYIDPNDSLTKQTLESIR